MCVEGVGDGGAPVNEGAEDLLVVSMSFGKRSEGGFSSNRGKKEYIRFVLHIALQEGKVTISIHWAWYIALQPLGDIQLTSKRRALGGLIVLMFVCSVDD